MAKSRRTATLCCIPGSTASHGSPAGAPLAPSDVSFNTSTAVSTNAYPDLSGWDLVGGVDSQLVVAGRK
jgi:hypothetical protein